MITDQILKSIDNINEVSEASSYAVLESMCTLIEKELAFEEFCSPEFFQEGEVLDNVKKRGKKDKNRLITILKFLPRLLAELGKAIKKWFSDKDLGDKIKNVGEDLAKDADIKTKRMRVAAVNKKNEGKFELYVDDNGKIKVKRDAKSLLATVAWLAGTAEMMVKLFQGIKDEFNLQDPSKIRNFTDECQKIIHMKSDKKFSEVADMGLDALGDLVKHISLSTGSIASLCLGAKSVVEKKLAKMEAEGGKEIDGSLASDLSQLLSKLTIINASIAAVGGVMSTIAHIGGYITPVIEKTEEEIADTNEAVKNVGEKIDKDIDDLKKANPKEADEDDKAYNKRIAKLYRDTHADVNGSEEINKEKKKIKEARAQKEQEEYDKAVEEYKAKKKEVKDSPTIFDKRKEEKAKKKQEKENQKQNKK